MQTNRSNTGALVGGTLLIAFGLLSLASEVFRGLKLGFLMALHRHRGRHIVLCGNVRRR